MFWVYIPIVLILTLSGCWGLGGAALTGAMTGSLFNSRLPSLKILCTAEDSIGLRYWHDELNMQHDEAMQKVQKHCSGEYVETKRVDYAVSSTVYFMCLQPDGSPPPSQSCKYIEAEQNPVGFGQEDPGSVDR